MDCEAARDLLIESVTGTTPPDLRRALDAHLRTCEACRAQAADLAHTVAVLRAVPEPHLPEELWTGFMGELDRRLEQETAGWRDVVRWVRKPRLAWSTAAASALVVALSAALLVHPTQRERVPSEEQSLRLDPFLTESVVQAIPSVTATLDLWKAGFTAADVSYDATPGGP